jgi:hypothetical protein
VSVLGEAGNWLRAEPQPLCHLGEFPFLLFSVDAGRILTRAPQGSSLAAAVAEEIQPVEDIIRTR